MFPLDLFVPVPPDKVHALKSRLGTTHGDFSLNIFTPCDKEFTAEYTMSLYNSTLLLDQLGIRHRFDIIQQCSIIDHARNRCVWKFLGGGCSHMLFIDSDIGWTPQDLWDLLWHITDQKCVMGATYPKKTINLDAMIDAKQHGLRAADHTGVIDKAMFSPIAQSRTDRTVAAMIDMNQPVSVKHMPMGFVVISRDVFETLQQNSPGDLVVEHGYEREQCLFFQTKRMPDSRSHGQRHHYWGEDLVFCHKVRGIGIDIKVLPWLTLTHVGKFLYRQDIKYNTDDFVGIDSGEPDLGNFRYL